MPEQFPHGRLDRIYLHWSAGDYTTTYDSYHYCIVWDGGAAHAVATRDLHENMRDVYVDDERPYAAHTYRRNAYAAGLAILGMKDARPDDFGDFPLREEAIDELCRLAAQIAQAYDLPIDAEHVLTHAEAAISDGYFGTGEDERWDIARLRPDSALLDPEDAMIAGDELRARIRLFLTP